MDATLRDLALRVIPVLDGTAGSKELFLFTSKYFANQLVGASNAAQEELGLIMASRLRGTYAVQAAQKKCKTHDELVSKVVR